MARIRSAFVAWSKAALTAGKEIFVVLVEPLTEYVTVTANESEKPPGSVHPPARQLLTWSAGRTNFGSAFESTATVEDGIALPLVPTDCSGAEVGSTTPAARVTVMHAERAELVPDQVAPTHGWL